MSMCLSMIWRVGYVAEEGIVPYTLILIINSICVGEETNDN